MNYFLIKGYFHVVGYSPDGDSLMFEAANAKQWDKIPSQFREIFLEKLKQKGPVQLRLQGVDALETHYSPSPVPTPKEFSGKSHNKAEQPKPGKFRQPAEFGDLATAKLLSELGAASVEWASRWGAHWIKEMKVSKGKKTVTYKTKDKDRLEGYIVVNDFEQKGRPISWIFGGKTSMRDGAKMTDSKLADRLKDSINYKLLSNGLVYPYFFMTLSAKLRNVLVDGVKDAQQQKLNLWAADKSEKGISLRKFSQVTDKYLIYPYLFRRMVKHQFKRQMEGYWEAVKRKKNYAANLEALFLDSFFADTNPYVFLIDERDFVRLDEIVQVSKTKFKLKTSPNNIVFLS